MTLTEQQRRAVETTERDVFVVAGPGSGKTSVLCARAVHLLNSGVRPESIMLCSFTRKAAAELQTRVSREACVLEDEVGAMHIGTFHALALSAMQSAGLKVRVIDDATLDDTIRMTARDLNYLKGKTWKGTTLGEVRAWLRERLINGPLDALAYGKFDIGEPVINVASTVMTSLAQNQLMSYDGLTASFALFLSRPLIDPDCWVAGITNVLIDEAQDLDSRQCEIVGLLQQRGASVFAVGDPRQRIYGWRDAVGYEAFSTLMLTESHRCPPAVLERANRLMNDYPALESAKTYSGRFHIEVGRTDVIVHWLRDLSGAYIRGWGDIAILTRTNRAARRYQSRLAELAPEIPTYRVGKAFDLTEFPEFRMIVAAMRLLADPCNPLLFRHACELLDVPRAAELEARTIAAHGGSFISAMSGAGMVAFDAMLELSVDKDADAADGRDTLTVVSVLNDNITAEPGIFEWWKLNCPMIRWAGLSDCLDWLAGYTADDEEVPDGHVVISTIHSAKGLEWPVVIVPDLNEGNLPTAQAIKAHEWTADGIHGALHNLLTDDAMDEERRCLYVAMTRAKEVCILHHRRPEHQAEGREIQAPSRFLEVIGVTHSPARAGVAGC